MRGVFVVHDRMLVRHAIDELLLIEGCTDQAEWAGLVVYLPLYISAEIASFGPRRCSREHLRPRLAHGQIQATGLPLSSPTIAPRALPDRSPIAR